MISPKSKLTRLIKKPKATWIEPAYYADIEYRDTTSEKACCGPVRSRVVSEGRQSSQIGEAISYAAFQETCVVRLRFPRNKRVCTTSFLPGNGKVPKHVGFMVLTLLWLAVLVAAFLLVLLR